MGTEDAAAGGSSRRAIRRFKDLEVWQTARKLAQGVYRAAETQRLRRDYALVDQMKRAVISISSNIAEGYEKGTRKQHVEGCFHATGSAGELRSQVIIAHDVGLLDRKAHEWLHAMCEKCSSLLAAYIRYLQRSQARIPGLKQSLARGSSNAG